MRIETVCISDIFFSRNSYQFKILDGRVDCTDGWDEKNCMPEQTIVKITSSTEIGDTGGAESSFTEITNSPKSTITSNASLLYQHISNSKLELLFSL